jgi:hypothetical protein
MFAVRVAFCAAFLASPGVSRAADSDMNAPALAAEETAQGGGIPPVRRERPFGLRPPQRPRNCPGTLYGSVIFPAAARIKTPLG